MFTRILTGISAVKKYIVLICNCKPYGVPVIESVGADGEYHGLVAENLASYMKEKNIHLTILSPRKIPGKNRVI